jgi:flagellar biogenesis protein FliO
LTPLNLATWPLSGRFTAAAPGATEFLGDAISAYERGKGTARETGAIALALGMLWKLCLVVALILVTVWLLRRTLKSQGLPLSVPGAVRILAVTHLDARHAVYLLEVGDRILVTGAGESLALLAEITSPVEKAALREGLKEGPGARFGSYLSAFTSRMSGGGSTRQQIEDGRDFLSSRLGALRRMLGRERQGTEDKEAK